MFLSCIAALSLLAAEPPIDVRPGKDARHVIVRAQLPEVAARTLPAGEVPRDAGEQWLCFSAADSPGTAIFGSYRRVDNHLEFRPRYGLLPGQKYRATLKQDSGPSAATEYEVPAQQPEPAPVIEKVYPSADVLPANLLKFYIHFSKPMREGIDIFDHLHLVDETGKEVFDPWRRTELWSKDGRRFTVWIHPGRIKTGVNLREELGPVLEPNRVYSLVIDADLKDLQGQPLGKSSIKKFRTTSPDRRRPLPDEWKIVAPKVGTRAPVQIDFGEPLDPHLVERLVTFSDADGKEIVGRFEFVDEERWCRFTPGQPWRAGQHRIRVADFLEDLVGNTPGRLFDVNLDEPAGDPPILELLFEPEL